MTCCISETRVSKSTECFLFGLLALMRQCISYWNVALKCKVGDFCFFLKKFSNKILLIIAVPEGVPVNRKPLSLLSSQQLRRSES